MSTTTKFITASLAVLAFGVVVSLGANQAFANTKGPSPHPRMPHPAGGASTDQHPAGSAGAVGSQVSGTYHPGTLVNNGNYHGHQRRLAEYCYWLPTVSNGSVSGLKPVCYWTKQ